MQKLLSRAFVSKFGIAVSGIRQSREKQEKENPSESAARTERSGTSRRPSRCWRPRSLIANGVKFNRVYGTDVPLVLPDPSESVPPPMQPISNRSMVRLMRVFFGVPFSLSSE
jgi:hypothetical protein